MPAQPTSASQLPQLADCGGIWRGLHTIDECVNNELPVLLHQVVDVAEDATVGEKTRSAIDHERLFPWLKAGAWPLQDKLRHPIPELWQASPGPLNCDQRPSGEPNGHRLDSRGWVCPTAKTRSRAPGGQSVCTPPLPPICLCFLVLSELVSGLVVVLYIPHLVKLVKQLLCLSSVVYQSWCVSRLRGVHNAA